MTNLVVEAEFDAQTWYGVLEAERVTVWYTAPTAIRMMMKLGSEATRHYDLSRLRFLASVGEPGPEAVVWGVEAFGQPFHDNWWQTETGGIMIANYAAMDVKPGSMGRPCPGSRPRSCAAARRASSRSPSPASRASWPCARAGHR